MLPPPTPDRAPNGERRAAEDDDGGGLSERPGTRAAATAAEIGPAAGLIGPIPTPPPALPGGGGERVEDDEEPAAAVRWRAAISRRAAASLLDVALEAAAAVGEVEYAA